jgi:pimeloyl-ACP methyl ester carboxylesterase
MELGVGKYRKLGGKHIKHSMLILTFNTNTPSNCERSRYVLQEYGNPKAEHVLFIHGLGASSLAWRDIPDALSEYFHTITVDLIGFGGSEKPENADYTVKGFSKFIMDFLIERIGIEEKEHTKISIVGHSLGGI